jgi:putative ABC transport system permease protein
LNTSLKEDGAGPGSHSRRTGFLRSTLVGVQVAVCMILLIAAGLLMRGLYYAQTVDPGFVMKDIAVATVDLTTQGYTDEQVALFQREFKERVAGLPGVDAVVQTLTTPLSGDHTGTNFSVPGRPDDYQLEHNFVSEGYFSMLEIPIVRGRDFTAAEARAGAKVLIVTESTGRKLWPGEDPVGKTLRTGSGTELQVVGVAKDAQVSQMGNAGKDYLYLPAAQREQKTMKLMVHGTSTYASTGKGIREAVQALDPELPVEVAALEDNLEIWRTPSRIVAALSVVLGTLALLLASIGVYGVVSYAVSRRMHEIGIRMAVGADGVDVMRLLMRQAMKPVAIGAVIGIGGCAAVSQVLSSMLFGLSAHDPIAFIGVPVLLMCVALVASYIPARRATRVDPVMALRYE